MLRELAKIPGIKIFGINDPESPVFQNKGGVISFSVNKIMPYRIANELAERGGIGVRYGCHCAHLLVKHLLNVGPSLERLQRLLVKFFPAIVFPGIVRVSIGLGNDDNDIKSFIHVLDQIIHHTKKKIPQKVVRQKISEFSGTVVQSVFQEPVIIS
jgi:selenocysteine lyase/cysteine desulfurase